MKLKFKELFYKEMGDVGLGRMEDTVWFRVTKKWFLFMIIFSFILLMLAYILYQKGGVICEEKEKMICNELLNSEISVSEHWTEKCKNYGIDLKGR